jgi:hypothetical protein
LLTKHPESHLDHVPEIVVTHILERFQDKTEFFIETFTLSDNNVTVWRVHELGKKRKKLAVFRAHSRLDK